VVELAEPVHLLDALRHHAVDRIRVHGSMIPARAAADEWQKRR
jgi:hypothetical protein